MANNTWLLRMSTPSLGTGPDPAWIRRAHPWQMSENIYLTTPQEHALWTDPDRCVDPMCYKVRIYIATPRGHAFDGTGPDRCLDPTCTSQHKQLNEDTPAHYELSERPTS
jgi:hypothetical protein